MAALRDPKLEKFTQALLSNLAGGMPRSKAAHEAGLTAGYTGKSCAANSRKRAQRKDVKARIAELAAPALAKAQDNITATLEWAEARLVRIAAPDLGDEAIRTPDQIKAIELLARFKGWLAPDKIEATGKDGAPLIPDVTDEQREQALVVFLAKSGLRGAAA